MKKSFVWTLLLCTLVMGCKSAPDVNPDAVSLNTAIREAAGLMETRLPAKTKIALINFTSPSAAFSEYVLDELSSVLVNDGVLVVVDRASLDKVRQELNFNMSGEVSDESAQEIGKILGAQAIVTGSLVSMGDLRRVMFKAIITESAAVAVQHNADIINDRRIEALLAQGGGSQTVAYNGQGGGNGKAAGGQTATGAAASVKPAEPSGPKDGTYTFYPRLRPYQGANLEDQVYLHKITVRGEYMNIYLTRNAEGATKEGPNGRSQWAEFSNSYRNIVLQSLDNPALSYTPETSGVGSGAFINDEGVWYAFKGIKTGRFSLTNKYRQPPSVFEEIVLGEPDAE